jgi:hypothetical protein
MTTREQLEQFFEGREWFDNSTISLIDACKRKGFYAKLGPSGIALDQRVGPAANFGTCFHSARAMYSVGFTMFDEPQRRLRAFRAFSDEWERYNWRTPKGLIPPKHCLDRGLEIFDAYCENYLNEDQLLIPIESELGFAVEMKPYAGDKCVICPQIWEPSWSQCPSCGWQSWINVGSVDGLFNRLYDGKLLPAELKTTSGDVTGRLRQLNFDHQPVSYVTCLRMFPGLEKLDTFIGDVVLTATKSFEFGRDYFTTNEIQRRSWHDQALNKIEIWRGLKRLAEGKTINEKLSIFFQNTKDCFSYGRCHFYELCDFGISREALEHFEAATWNPLLHRIPQKTLIVADGDVDSISKG